MSFKGLILTDKGREELAKAELGEPLVFDYIAIGDGDYTGSTTLLESLVNELHQLPILSVKREKDSIIVEADLSNENLQESFYFREIGIYANGVLYAYDNAGQEAEYIDAVGAAVVKQKRIRVVLKVAPDASVAIKIDSGLYALQKDLDICNSKIDILGNKLENYLDPDGGALSATKAMQDGDGNVISETYAKRSIYGDSTISLGMKNGSKLGSGSVVIGGRNNSATGDYGSVSGGSTNEAGNNCFVGGGVGNKAGQAFMSAIVGGQSNKMQEDYSAIAGGDGNTVNGRYSFIGGGSFNETRENFSAVLGGYRNIASGMASCAAGDGNNASNHSSFAVGHYSKIMKSGGHSSNQIGDAFVIGNGTGSSTLSNALRVTYLGDILGTKAFQSSGADYAEFIKPWADGNPDNEDRVGYFVTIKDGYLHKANEGDYITGITSGNPSVVGNADEDYYWRYERDNFNRIVMEDVPETVQATDDEENPLFDEETHEPIMVETGNIIPNARMKLAKDYDPSLQESYVERKDRKEWDYVGMLGVLPVRDDGSCIPGQFCKSKNGGIATFAAERSIDTYMVLERISDNVVSVILK